MLADAADTPSEFRDKLNIAPCRVAMGLRRVSPNGSRYSEKGTCCMQRCNRGKQKSACFVFSSVPVTLLFGLSCTPSLTSKTSLVSVALTVHRIKRSLCLVHSATAQRLYEAFAPTPSGTFVREPPRTNTAFTSHCCDTIDQSSCD